MRWEAAEYLQIAEVEFFARVGSELIAGPTEHPIALHTEFAAKRCVQCSEVVDSVIPLNRQLKQEPMTVQRAGKTLSNHCVSGGPYEECF